jgi:hypothetical protein
MNEKAGTRVSDPKATAIYHAIAYHLLFSLEQQKNPKLTVGEFRKHLYDSHVANVKAAKAQHDAKHGGK